MREADFQANKWLYYTNYICVLASNGSCCRPFLDIAFASHPDMTFLPRMSELLDRMGKRWKQPEDAQPRSLCLEQLGGGFHISLETLRDPEKRSVIVRQLSEAMLTLIPPDLV